MTIAGLRNKFLISLAFGAAVFLAIAIYGDLPNLLTAFATFDWALLPLILGLTLANYGLRFLKWQFYLRVIGVRNLGLGHSFLIFFSGLSMVMTPGKVGEWLKSFLLKEVAGTPLTRSAPIIVAERLTDGIAMLLLALVGVLAFNVASEFVIAGGVVMGLALAVVQIRPLALGILAIGERLPVIAPRIHHFHALYESSYVLLRFRALIPAVLLGVVSWGLECVALFFVFEGLGVEASWTLLLQSTFILATATLAGSLLLLPGGLGVAEASIVGLTQLLLEVPRSTASAAALLIRLGTLWFGVVIGLICLLIFLRAQSAAKRAAILRDVESAEASVAG